MLNYLSGYKSLLYELSVQKENDKIETILDEHKDWFEEEDGIVVRINILKEELKYKSLKIEAGYKPKDGKSVKTQYFQKMIYFID